jgi:general secretion pathway protein G
MAFRYIEKARQVTARSQIETLSLALDAYATDCKSYPTPDQGLNALWTKPTAAPIPADWNGPYVNKPVGMDPWGHAWDYTVPGPGGLPFGLRSFGADGKEGGDGNDKDVASWDN